MYKGNAIPIIAMAFVLAAPCIALADKKKVNTPRQITPRENVTFTYGKIKYNYTPQRTNNPYIRKDN